MKKFITLLLAALFFTDIAYAQTEQDEVERRGKKDKGPKEKNKDKTEKKINKRRAKGRKNLFMKKCSYIVPITFAKTLEDQTTSPTIRYWVYNSTIDGVSSTTPADQTELPTGKEYLWQFAEGTAEGTVLVKNIQTGTFLTTTPLVISGETSTGLTLDATGEQFEPLFPQNSLPVKKRWQFWKIVKDDDPFKGWPGEFRRGKLIQFQKYEDPEPTTPTYIYQSLTDADYSVVTVEEEAQGTDYVNIFGMIPVDCPEA